MTSFSESHEARSQARAALKARIEDAVASTSLTNADAAAVSMGMEYAIDSLVRHSPSLTRANLAYVALVRDLRSNRLLEHAAQVASEVKDTGRWNEVRSARFSAAYHTLRLSLLTERSTP